MRCECRLFHCTFLLLHKITTGAEALSVLSHLSQRHHLLLEHPPGLFVLRRRGFFERFQRQLELLRLESFHDLKDAFGYF